MEAVFTRITRESVRIQVFEQLLNQIVRRKWSPGSKIPSENALAKELGVSRVSIREALGMLASLGLLETQQGGGTFIKEYSGDVLLNPLFSMLVLDRTDILDVLEYRRIVEKGIVALVVEKAGEAEIAELERAYRIMVDNTDDLHAFARGDLDFHIALARATGNPIVIKVNDIVKSVLSSSMEGIVEALGVRDGLFYHRKIIDAIKARNSEEAQALMEEHVLRTIERLREKG